MNTWCLRVFVVRHAVRKTKRHDIAGFSLLEILVYAAILAVIINLAAGVFVTSSRLSILGTTALDRMGTIEEIRKDFTDAVRHSHGVYGKISTYTSGNEQVVLRAPESSEQEGVERYVVFGPVCSTSRLSKLVLSERDGECRIESVREYPLELDRIRFRYDDDSPERSRLVSLEILTKNNENRPEKGTTHTFAVAMRCFARGGAGT